MSSTQTVLITGACGGIGTALVHLFQKNGYRVIATDVVTPSASFPCDYFIQADLERIVEKNSSYAKKFFERIHAAVDNFSFMGLINNAAIQIVRPAHELTAQDWQRTLNINTIAPFLLIQSLLSALEKTGGSVVNISSVHSSLTKPHFVSYATSKSALSGLTRSMAVELGKAIRINAIAPAAVETRMLKESFVGKEEKFHALNEMHPVGRIGNPIEVAELALFLISEKAKFINGAVFQLDGGISSRLHDPD